MERSESLKKARRVLAQKRAKKRAAQPAARKADASVVFELDGKLYRFDVRKLA